MRDAFSVKNDIVFRRLDYLKKLNSSISYNGVRCTDNVGGLDMTFSMIVGSALVKSKDTGKNDMYNINIVFPNDPKTYKSYLSKQYVKVAVYLDELKNVFQAKKILD
jgi:hypothetical protein